MQWKHFLCAVFTHSEISKKYRKTSPMMNKYGGDKVQGVTDIEKHLHREPQSLDHVINVDA